MTVQGGSPNLLRKQLGRRFRGYREARGETAVEVADALETHPSAISRLETGQRLPGMLLVNALCRHYRLDRALQAELAQMARDSRRSGWWERYKVSSASKTYIGWESAATLIKNLEISVVPGLLQTSAYASAIIAPIHPDFPPQQISMEVEVRAKRKEILGEGGLRTFHAIVDESALVRRIGDDRTMRDQLAELLTVTENPRVVLQILPFTAGSTKALDGSFSVLSFDDDEIDDFVYAEGALGMLYEADAANVGRANLVFDELIAIAADRDESLALIKKAWERYS